MPVFFTCAKHDGVADCNLLGTLAPALNPHSTLDDQEPLRTRMPVPVRTPTILEVYVIHVNRRVLDRGREQFDMDRSDKRLGVGRV